MAMEKAEKVRPPSAADTQPRYPNGKRSPHLFRACLEVSRCSGRPRWVPARLSRADTGGGNGNALASGKSAGGFLGRGGRHGVLKS